MVEYNNTKSVNNNSKRVQVIYPLTAFVFPIFSGFFLYNGMDGRQRLVQVGKSGIIE